LPQALHPAQAPLHAFLSSVEPIIAGERPAMAATDTTEAIAIFCFMRSFVALFNHPSI
jgi:hypothetical protein